MVGLRSVEQWLRVENTFYDPNRAFDQRFPNKANDNWSYYQYFDNFSRILLTFHNFIINLIQMFSN